MRDYPIPKPRPSVSFWLLSGLVLVGLVALFLAADFAAEQAGFAAGITNPWQLLTLALGPLSALAFLAMAVGRELGEHEMRLAAWQVNRQKWLEDWEARRHAQQLEAEKIRLNAELKKEKELARLELRERRRLMAAQSAQLPEIVNDSEVTFGKLPRLRGNRLKVYEIARGNPDATHQEIADMLDISRQAVTSHIGKLRDAGILNGNHRDV